MFTSLQPHSDAPHRMEHVDRRSRARRGFTLVELVVVLVIVAAVAAIGALSVSAIAAQAPRDVTQASFAELRTALANYRTDVGVLPDTIDDLFTKPADVLVFDIATRRGWRGPYLTSSSARYALHPVAADDGFTDEPHDPPIGAPVPADGWGRPIVLQVPDVDGVGPPSALEREHARIVSAGDDGRVDTPRAGAGALLPTSSQCDDDLVLFLRVADTRAP